MPRGRRNQPDTPADTSGDLEQPSTLIVTTTEFTVIADRGVLCALQAAGAVGTVTWGLVGHPNMGDAVEWALPPGMHMVTHGLSGHPTTPGVFEVWVQATDESHPAPQSVTALVTVVVEDPIAAPIVPALTQTLTVPKESTDV